jgi:hypothetical protein
MIMLVRGVLRGPRGFVKLSKKEFLNVREKIEKTRESAYLFFEILMPYFSLVNANIQSAIA